MIIKFFCHLFKPKPAPVMPEPELDLLAYPAFLRMKDRRKRTDYIVVHCAATPPNLDADVSDIDRWHKQKRWAGVGYHFVIKRDGTLQAGRGIEDLGAHVSGKNSISLGVCLIGGVNKAGKAENNFTDAQFNMLRRVLAQLEKRYPRAKILGHRDLDNMKACPCFDVQKWYNRGAEGSLSKAG